MPLTDSDLISKIHHGDLLAFNQLFKRYQDSVYRFACYLTQNRGQADDLFQDAWLRVVKYLPSKNDVRNFRAWIFRITTNLHRDEIRKRRIRKPFWSLRTVTDDYGDDNRKHRHQNVIPMTADYIENIELGPAITRAISRLPLKQRRIFILKEIEGFKHKEISDILNLPEGTVKSLLHRAVKFLQRELADYRSE